MNIRIHFSFLCALLSAAMVTAAQSGGEEIFRQKCTACHTIGGGKLVGPDLQGVTERREEAWLKRQIKTPDVMIAEKDSIVMGLLKESNNIPMAPLGLSDNEVDAVIAFFRNTAQEKAVAGGVPTQYVPTILISIAVMLAITFLALRAGRKNAEVR